VILPTAFHYYTWKITMAIRILQWIINKQTNMQEDDYCRKAREIKVGTVVYKLSLPYTTMK
jgi:hypothetical protein